MAASERTIKMVLEVVKKHVDQETLLRVVKELEEVPGHGSFRETIERLAEMARQEGRK
jgi:hypothetical protein